MTAHRYVLLCMLLALLGMVATGLQAQAIDTNVEIAYDLDWRPQGDVLSVAGDTHVWLLDAQLQILDAYPYPHKSDDNSHISWAIEWSPDGEWLATIHQGWLQVWSYPAGILIFDSQLIEPNVYDTMRWHPTEPLLSTYGKVVNIQSGTVEKPYPVDVYWGRSIDDPPFEQRMSGEVFWSPDGTQLIRLISVAYCDPCSEYGVFDALSGELLENLGSNLWDSDRFVWSVDDRYRDLDSIIISDGLFDSQIERLVYVETGVWLYFRMPAIFVVNTFEDQDVTIQQVTYPIPLRHIDWTPDVPYGVTALNCDGEILSLDIRDMSVSLLGDIFAPAPPGDSVCGASSVLPGYGNP